jgi:glycosyl hydrolase family 39 (putative alpha-L-iduronidase)/YXYXY domain-containing protein
MRTPVALLAAALFALSHGAALHAAPVNIRAPDLKVAGGDWRPYNLGDSPEGGSMGWLHANVKSVDGIIALPQALPPGTYFFFLKGINYDDGSRLQLSCGGGTSAPVRPDNRDWNGQWTEQIRLQVNQPADSVTLTLIKVGDPSRTDKYLLRGLYITGNPDVVVDGNDTVIRASYPTRMDDSAPARGNLFPNGSFEAGTGHGWGFSAGGGSREYSLKSLWNRTQAFHGQASLRLPPWVNLVSRVLRVRPNRRHTLSFWARSAETSASISVSVYNVHALPTSLKPVINLTQSFALKAGWQRVSVSGYLLDYPNDEYQVKVSTQDAGVWMDALQLEEGDPSEFRTKLPLEIGLDCDKPGSIYFNDEPVAMQLLAHNGTHQAIKGSVGYAVYDYLNRKVKAGAVELTAPAKGTGHTRLDLSTGKQGIFRVVAWVEGRNGDEEEAAYCVVPRPRVSGRDADSIIGIHANASTYQYQALARLGIKWQRILSPTAWFRWSAVEPAKGQLVWYDDEVRKTTASGFEILGNLGTWPAWADRGGRPDLDEWERYVAAVVEHYKGQVKHWEVWNEPIHEFSASFYAELFRRAARAIRRADPQAKIVGMGGSYKSAWCLEVLEQLGGKPSEQMDYVATHLYPPGSDPLNPSSGLEAKEFHDRIIAPYGMPVWNTEAGVWCMGFYHGANSSFRSPGESLWPHQDGVRYYRGAGYEAERMAYSFLHSIGNGLSRYFYYDSRFHAAPDYYRTHPTIFDFDDTVRTKGVAYAILAYLFDHSRGLGNLSPNANSYAYLFDRRGQPVVALWSADTSPKTITLDLAGSQFKVYDMMGNTLSPAGATIRYGRQPVYLEGRAGVAVARMKSALGQAKIADAADTAPPSSSISEAPRGLAGGGRVRVRWIAIDDTSVPANNCPDVLLYSHRLVGRDAEWSGWSARTYADYEALGSGRYRFEVRARDAAGNISETTREFRTANNANAKCTKDTLLHLCGSYH